MINIKCDKEHPPMTVETCGEWTKLAEEAANIIKGMTCSLLKQLPPTAQWASAGILKEAYALGYREGLKQLKEIEADETEVTENETAD